MAYHRDFRTRTDGILTDLTTKRSDCRVHPKILLGEGIPDAPQMTEGLACSYRSIVDIE